MILPLCTLAIDGLADSRAGLGLVSQVNILPPVLILVLCVAAGVGTVFMLPGRRETSWAKIGGVIALAAGLILAAMLVHYTSSPANGGRGGMSTYFWIFSAIAIISALRVITHPRPVYSALYFVLTVLASAGLFILLWAEFMAAALVVIYAGAILVTYVFVIMLAQQSQQTMPGAPALAGLAEYDRVSREPVPAAVIGFALMGVLLFVIFDRSQGLASPAANPGVAAASALPEALAADAPSAQTQRAESSVITTAPAGSAGRRWQPPYNGTAQSLGLFLFQDQLFNVELAGLMLTIRLVGAIVIARRRVVGPADAFEPQTETLNGPATPVNDNPHSIPVYGTDNPRAKAYPQT